MNVALQNLLQLQALEFDAPANQSEDTEIKKLRGLIPAPILGHYDRLRVRGKKGVAVVRNNVCTGCHMQQPIGKIMIVMRGEDLQLCDTCGRYLHVPDAAESQFVEKMAAAKPAGKETAKPASKPRKRKTAALAGAAAA